MEGSGSATVKLRNPSQAPEELLKIGNLLNLLFHLGDFECRSAHFNMASYKNVHLISSCPNETTELKAFFHNLYHDIFSNKWFYHSVMCNPLFLSDHE